jgi:hypothetical protein
VNQHASPDFWTCYRALPTSVQELGDKAYAILKRNPRHPFRRFKRVARFWSVRVGLHYRAVGVDARDGVVWFWIGTHADYDHLFG